MIRELSPKEKQEYDRLTRFCTQLTLADFSEDRALKNLPATRRRTGAQEDTEMPFRKHG
jgi:hypothetical protein